MSVTINGSGTITGITAGGLPDATITQAELATGVTGTGPAFSAYATGSQSLSQNTDTRLVIQNEEFDTASCFNNTGSTVGGIPAYSFMPNVAGYYQVNFGAYGISSSGTVLVITTLYKNNVGISNSLGCTSYIYGGGTSFSDGASAGSTLVYMNGTTDYLSSVVRVLGSGSAATGNARFSAFLARAA